MKQVLPPLLSLPLLSHVVPQLRFDGVHIAFRDGPVLARGNVAKTRTTSCREGEKTFFKIAQPRYTNMDKCKSSI